MLCIYSNEGPVVCLQFAVPVVGSSAYQIPVFIEMYDVKFE